MLRTSVLFFLSLLSCNCVKARPHGLNYLVPAPCLTAPVRLLDCDGSNPPQCKKIAMNYRSSCAELDAGKK